MDITRNVDWVRDLVDVWTRHDRDLKNVDWHPMKFYGFSYVMRFEILHTNANYIMREKLGKNIIACLMWCSTKMCTFYIVHSNNLAPIWKGVIGKWKLWCQCDSLASWVMMTPPFIFSKTSCCAMWKWHRYGNHYLGHLFYSTTRTWNNKITWVSLD
jgi:hypothetical protein